MLKDMLLHRNSGEQRPPATNIVEGYKRASQREFSHFLNVADSSLEETKYHLLLARDLGYLKEADYNRLTMAAEEAGRMLFGFRKRILAQSVGSVS